MGSSMTYSVIFHGVKARVEGIQRRDALASRASFLHLSEKVSPLRKTNDDCVNGDEVGEDEEEGEKGRGVGRATIYLLAVLLRWERATQAR
jgi:hypothetical protein